MSESVYWPAEWHPHDATWLAWPHQESTWPGRLDRIPPVFDRLARTLGEVESVHVLGGPGESFEQARDMLQGAAGVQVHRITTDDCWIRDYGPTWVLEDQGRRVAGVDWHFNAWGSKYESFLNDRVAARRILHCCRHRRIASPLTCEGGGLETDGQGTLLATSSSLLTASRNPGWTRQQIERELALRLGIEKVLWIDGGSLAGDDTDSHIDQLVRFVAPGRVVAAVSSRVEDTNAPGLVRQWQSIQGLVDARGRRLECIALPIPPPRFIQGIQVPESYCNFYIANELVVVPQFGYRATDEQAMGILREQFPAHTLVGIDASDLVWGRGAFHCATQQQPRPLPANACSPTSPEALS
ncbi:MAG: agmatine/peptidylarginine deiminase [Pirellulaceae bacterium]|jgi:agmatine deiminase